MWYAVLYITLQGYGITETAAVPDLDGPYQDRAECMTVGAQMLDRAPTIAAHYGVDILAGGFDCTQERPEGLPEAI